MFPPCLIIRSVYVELNSIISSFKTSDSWVVLSQIENNIRRKINSKGVPLSEWDIAINYGIKTGLNDAFIISGQKKDELITLDPKSAEIIRPILRGRDIQRFGYNFAHLWLINVHNGLRNKNLAPISIDDYPAIKKHLDNYFPKLEKRFDKGITPYNLRNCAYMDVFSKQKIIYPNMTKYLPFYLDNDGFYTNQKCFIIAGDNLGFLTAFLNSNIFKFCYRDSFPELQGGTRELSKIFFEKVPVMKVSDTTNLLFTALVCTIQDKRINNLDTSEEEARISNMINDLYQITNEENNYIEEWIIKNGLS